MNSLAVQWLGLGISTSGGMGLIPEQGTVTVKLLHSCPTLCNPIDGSSPGSPVPGILQARVLEWGAIAFSGGSMLSSLISRLSSD